MEIYELSLDGEVKSLLVRTDEGDVEFLAGHADYFAHLAIGRARILTDDGERFASVNGGCVMVSGGSVTLSATTFEFAEDIDVERAKASMDVAQRRLQSAKDERAAQLAKAKLMRAINRINVADLR
jgi:F-type H+-transporting ATPase subunit epsilon